MMGSMGDHALQSDEPIAHISEDGRVHSLREHLEGNNEGTVRGKKDASGRHRMKRGLQVFAQLGHMPQIISRLHIQPCLGC